METLRVTHLVFARTNGFVIRFFTKVSTYQTYVGPEGSVDDNPETNEIKPKTDLVAQASAAEVSAEDRQWWW